MFPPPACRLQPGAVRRLCTGSGSTTPASAAPHAAVLPPGCAPGRRVEAVATVDDESPDGERRGVLGAELPTVLVPLGDDNDGVGAGEGLVAVGFVAELGVYPPGVVEGLRVGDDDAGAEAVEAHGDIERGGVADVVGVGFEGGPEDGHVFVDDGSTETIDDERHGVIATPEVDGVDLFEERHGGAAPEFFGAGGEGANVFGQAAAAETDAGSEEASADAFVVADGVGELGDVGAGGFGDFRHGVDEGDLGGKKRVGRHFHQLGGGVVGDDARSAGGNGFRIHVVEDLGGARAGFTARHPVHEAIRRQGVLHGEPFAQKLRVPHQGRPGRRDELGEAGGGADGHGRLPDDEVTRGKDRQQPFDGRFNIPEVCRIAVVGE